MIYEAIMSKGEKIKIDEEDLNKINENIHAPFIRVKQAMINPSFLVMIVPTNQPDVIEKYKMDVSGGSAIITGTEEVKVLSDLMSSEVKRLK